MHSIRYDAEDRVKSLDAVYYYPGQYQYQRVAVQNNNVQNLTSKLLTYGMYIYMESCWSHMCMIYTNHAKN